MSVTEDDNVSVLDFQNGRQVSLLGCASELSRRPDQRKTMLLLERLAFRLTEVSDLRSEIWGFMIQVYTTLIHWSHETIFSLAGFWSA